MHQSTRLTLTMARHNNNNRVNTQSEELQWLANRARSGSQSSLESTISTGSRSTNSQFHPSIRRLASRYRLESNYFAPPPAFNPASNESESDDDDGGGDELVYDQEQQDTPRRGTRSASIQIRERLGSLRNTLTLGVRSRSGSLTPSALDTESSDQRTGQLAQIAARMRGSANRASSSPGAMLEAVTVEEDDFVDPPPAYNEPFIPLPAYRE